jgi:hypothetical protein
MSDYNVIHAVSETLKQLLWSSMQHDAVITSIIGATDFRISFDPPNKLVKEDNPDSDCLSLYLYRVVENGEMKNRPPEPRDSHTLRNPPLSLNLFYLVTPLTDSADKDHKLLGKTMQIFYDNALVKGEALKGILENTAEELRLILNPISMEDITKLWSAFLRPYRLSVCYEVKVIHIDSERETEGERVRRKRLEFTQYESA